MRPCVVESPNFDTAQNIYIEGDNLDALKLLKQSYLNKVKMIYINPPYNTARILFTVINFIRTPQNMPLKLNFLTTTAT